MANLYNLFSDLFKPSKDLSKNPVPFDITDGLVPLKQHFSGSNENMSFAKIFQNVAPKANPDLVATLSNSPNVLKEYGIDNPYRLKHFLSQMAHETGGFRAMEEIGNKSRYKGRGFIQLTGKSNYRTYGQKLGIDLENNPELAAKPDIALRVAGQFWKDHGLNELADKDNVRQITKRINGGYNGLRDRMNWLKSFSPHFSGGMNPEESNVLRPTGSELQMNPMMMPQLPQNSMTRAAPQSLMSMAANNPSSGSPSGELGGLFRSLTYPRRNTMVNFNG